mmetsp:Transcript_16275/g.24522  ORF Transcript_16275/g.24522 Transcript_16275/m.24522 type:complete len:613 (+) Transcript_16275:137-1975(+)|eukprot:CAMPEP_0185036348 /NCGR_PEP_ID=MMETSP1103-20130426/29202_1 /TAXON_ID=36769 /ORGANISM="Paraphysomonas bandaiensis, Strain Caron Lab Isolate" /LENGTH=612 /DNA_ID=CAMNT_0027573859 /DNA_START=102 /DNA_END=1940 /DNA_ORIENTATION=-
MTESNSSASAILTLLGLIFAGPAYYAIRYLYNRHIASENTIREQEMVDVSKVDIISPVHDNGVKHSKSSDDIIGKNVTEISKSDENEPVSSSSYMLGLLGYAIGIGNVWRFPYLVGQYGGGAFVFAYLICLFLVAMPLYLVELGLGQYTRLGAIETLNSIRPRWRALGWAQVGMVTCICAYYNVLLAYSCLYIIASCMNPLPWDSKDSEEYWDEDVLNSYSEGGPLGPVQWKIAVSLLFVYILVFFSVGFGKKVLTDVTWVTVVGPIALMIILFFRCISLPGASNGIEFYLGKFSWSELYNGELWAVACGQIIFSLSPGCGTAIALSSVANPKEDVYRVCLTVGLANSAFSLFGGFAMFSILGNLAHNTDQTVDDVASQSGTGLAFISIAEGITHFGSASNVMAILFFLMLLCLGLDSTFAWLETLISALEDLCKSYNKKLSHVQVVGFLCCILFLLGIPFCTRGGNSLLDVIDHFVGSYFLLFSCFLESLAFAWDFGWPRFSAVIREATKGNVNTPNGRDIYPARFWQVCVCYIVPLTTGGLLLSMFIRDTFFTIYGEGDYTAGLVGVGWAMFFLLVIASMTTLCDTMPGRLPDPPANRMVNHDEENIDAY